MEKLPSSLDNKAIDFGWKARLRLVILLLFSIILRFVFEIVMLILFIIFFIPMICKQEVYDSMKEIFKDELSDWGDDK